MCRHDITQRLDLLTPYDAMHGQLQPILKTPCSGICQPNLNEMCEAYHLAVTSHSNSLCSPLRQSAACMISSLSQLSAATSLSHHLLYMPASVHEALCGGSLQICRDVYFMHRIPVKSDSKVGCHSYFLLWTRASMPSCCIRAIVASSGRKVAIISNQMSPFNLMA